MPFKRGIEFIKNAQEQEQEEKLFLRWVAGYQSATTFEEFKDKLKTKAQVSNDSRSSEEILDEVERLMQRFAR